MVTSQLAVVELYSIFSQVMNVSDIELEALVNYVIRKCGIEVSTIEWDELYTQSLNYANKLKLRTLDLLHVIAAYSLGAKILVTFDKDIINKGKLVKELLGIKITSY